MQHVLIAITDQSSQVNPLTFVRDVLLTQMKIGYLM